MRQPRSWRDYHEYKVDFCWEDRKTVAETDVLAKYSTREDALNELKRDRLLRERGYKVVHITPEALSGSASTNRASRGTL